ncbi:hypothetical protein [Fuerstiella marisgermanici]|uniref:Uncharacterized protein n=1 Tax=Fuerstiella marisgermanici TaxID=1891926 RepID=A0A1P8WKI4_9PLAN|nr:hypothetical protein [Fuerstiella marisgermanici]APZ94551.1 hypothetical protein Fuma_04183 [Fuerstiella marisgermanici]
MNEPIQQSEPAGPKIGQGHAAAMMRLGGKELSNVLPAFPESIQPVEEYGLFGTQLPSEIAEARKGPEMEVQHNMELEM